MRPYSRMQRNNRQSTARKSKIRIPDTFWGALAIILLSTLPYLHDFLTDDGGLKPWVPVLGIEDLLTDVNGNVLGFSTYRGFLYTFFIFLFATIGWAGWFQSARQRFYGSALLLATASGLYHIFLILFGLRRSLLNEPVSKLVFLGILSIVLGYMTIKKRGYSLRKVVCWVLLFLMATLPFYHDLITNRSGETYAWVPKLGIEEMLTDNEGYVRGLANYRILVYLFCLYLFAHLGWIGWFFDSRGKKYRPFILVPAALSLYQVVVIAMSWRETEFNDPNIKLYITIGLSILLAINFYYNNKVSPEAKVITENGQS